MPRIPFIESDVSGGGVPDLATQRPNTAFAELGQSAGEAENLLTRLAEQEAAIDGASALADFKVAREKRQTELRTTAKAPETFTETALSDFDDAAEELVSAHDNPRVQAFLGERLHKARADEEIESDAWAAGVMVQRREQKAVEAVNKFANIVNSAPSKFEASLADVDAMIDASDLPLPQADKLRAAARGALSRSAVYGQIETNPGGILKQLQGGKWDDYLDNDAKISAVNAAQVEIKRRQAEARAAQAAATSDAMANMSVRINRFANGQADDVKQEEIDALKPGLRPSAWAELQRSFDDARARRDRDQAERVNVVELIDAGGHIDPGNSKQVKAYDGFFRNSVLPQIEQATAGLPADQRASAATSRVLSFVQSQGVVPETMKSNIRASLRGGSPEQKAAAAATLDQIRVVAPRSFADFDDDTKRQANTISAYIDGGMTPAQAVALADEALRRPKIVDDALVATYRELTKTDLTSDWLTNALDERWFSDPSAGVAVTAEVDNLVRSEFQRNGGNLEGARRTALDMVKKRFGTTIVNGEATVVRNPVEAHYKLPWQTPDEAASAIRKEALADVSIGGATDAPLTPDRVRVLPYPAKGVIAPDGRPAYAIEVQDSAGGWTVQMDLDPKSPTVGLPKPWWPAQAKAKAEREAVIKQAIEAQKLGRVPLTAPGLPGAGIQ